MASKKLNHPLTRGELQFLDRALLAGEIVVSLKHRRLAPEGLAHEVADYAIALLLERRRIRSRGAI